MEVGTLLDRLWNCVGSWNWAVVWEAELDKLSKFVVDWNLGLGILLFWNSVEGALLN